MSDIGNKVPDGIWKKDLRVQKTHKALYASLLTLLGRRNFNDITVNDLCVEAYISRPTFYTHFSDKYDLLRYFLAEIRTNIIKDVNNYEELERDINQFVDSNKKVITNIMKNANGETLMLMREFMSSIVELIIKKKDRREKSENHIILFSLCSGGLVNLLSWMVDNGFPSKVNMMNTYLYGLLDALTTWDAQQ